MHTNPRTITAARDAHHVEKVRMSLKAAGIPEHYHDAAIDNMDRNGLIPQAGPEMMAATHRRARLQAALTDKAKIPAIRYAEAQLRKIGLGFECELHQLNAALDAHNVPVERRIELKCALSDLGVLE
jgi:hypothetical protein